MRSTLALAAAGLAFATTASAAGEPTAYAHAQLGSLSVVSGVLVSRTAADMRGVWNDEHVSCKTTRLLTVRILIDHVPSGKRFARTGRFKDVNCAEGGPNVGFTVTARKAGLACPSGAWKPGRYDFVTTTTEPTRKLLATASLLWTNLRACSVAYTEPMLQRVSARTLPLINQAAEHAPVATACCNACRTCVSTNIVGLAVGGALALAAAAKRLGRRGLRRVHAGVVAPERR